MRNHRIKEDFFRHPTLLMAEKLLGMVLVHKTPGGELLKGKIVETEAYLAAGDRACHAYRGMTQRNRPMFASPGTVYIYFTYGNHYLMNIVTEPEGTAGAVLLRALEPLEGIPVMERNRGSKSGTILTNGPGKLTQAMSIGPELNSSSLLHSHQLYIEEGDTPLPEEIGTSERIGITQSTELPWRKYISSSPYVSGKAAARCRKKHHDALES
ncbi:DNA-3-methyladenine glycosylase [Prosthecochloris sp. CIB 2401]|uniref:DNA-3-methyladenine glycosylase n=1 Tax=Prosthecochloris sp. CIB 2401 TaxID=1868325 RepID=UPI00080AA483|nr:DNA-3-methyladenine glycosylase [Prosthecochloris sp. CIB 2401]ANT65705.1 3-methyladenine DNA glycosylase [Prosthecochloris sp. CIB 2401]